MDILQVLVNVGSGITAVGIIVGAVSKIVKKSMTPIYNKIDNLDKNQCKAYLVDFLSDLENGIKKDEVQVKLAYEIYDRYTIDLKCNSYIHDKWEKLMKNYKF